MTLPVANLVKDAIEVIYSVAAEDKTVPGARSAAQKLNELGDFLNRQYVKAIADLLVTDATDAGVSEFIGGGEGDALSVGDVFRTLGTGDLTDDIMATEKGSALAAGDVWVIDGADSNEYLGNNADGKPFDFAGERSHGDFQSYGS